MTQNSQEMGLWVGNDSKFEGAGFVWEMTQNSQERGFEREMTQNLQERGFGRGMTQNSQALA
jgi:hypothetical protein